MKRIIISIIIFILSLLPVKGDVNLDGKVDKADVETVLNYYVGSEELTAKQKIAADVNHDGRINSLDAVKIMIIAGI